MGYLVGNEGIQVLILFRAFGNLFCSDSKFKPIIYCQLTTLEFMRSYSQRKLVKESKILCNTMK